MRNKKRFTPVRQQTSCGKNCYQSREEADAVAREQEIIFIANDLKLKSYRCVACGSWHLTRLTDKKHHI
jgi:arylsulfatase A-like enzyme